MFENQIEALSLQLDLSKDEAEKLLSEAQEFYDVIEAHKADKCPMAMSLAMTAQTYHINIDDDYGLNDMLGDFSMGVQADVIDAVANTEEC